MRTHSGSHTSAAAVRTTHHHLALFFIILLLALLPAFARAGILDPAAPSSHAHIRRAAVDGTYSIAGQPNAGGNVYVQVFGDADPAMVYSKGWNVRTSSSLNLTDGMEHVTVLPSSTLTFQFHGTALSLIGTTGPNHGSFSVRIDTKLHNDLSSRSNTAATGQTLFTVTGLADGDAAHDFELTHEDKCGVELDVDAVVVWGDAGTVPSPTPVLATTIDCSGATSTPVKHRHHPAHGASQNKHFSFSVTDSGGIGFPFSCPVSVATEPGGGGGGGSSPATATFSRDPSGLQTAVPSATPSLSTTLPDPDTAGKTNQTHMTATLIGGVLGGLAGVGGLAALSLVSYRRLKEGKPLFGFLEIAQRAGDRSPSVQFGESTISTVNTTGASSLQPAAAAAPGGAGMVETLANGGIAGYLVAGEARRPGMRDLPPRSFDVSRPVRTMAPLATMGLSPYFSPTSPGAVGRPTHVPQESSATNNSGETSYSGPSDIKHIALAGGRVTPSSSEDHVGTSGSSSGHGRPSRRSTSRTLDPYLNRRNSVLSVRNPDVNTDDNPDATEEMATPGGAVPRTSVRISEGYLYDPSLRESHASLRTQARSLGHSYSNSGSSSSHTAEVQFRSPHAIAFQPELVNVPPPPMSAAASVFGPSSYRRPISTLYEEEFYHSGRSSTGTQRESYPAARQSTFAARESYATGTRESFPSVAARPSVDGDHVVDPVFAGRVTPSPWPQGGSENGPLHPPVRRWRQSIDNTSAGTPSSIQAVNFGAGGYFSSPTGPDSHTNGWPESL